eukprot:TRINITY_DN10293_c0_g1_i2.p1 TRINITY_DN10293_c0_g1~~TRINITY_DN10293_c0_g1_i2.p1  ORF type:complete len:246 (-),score=34.97 TRINITY_DN10293_c0_g1_i2:109-846(-)
MLTGPYATGQGKTALLTVWRAVFPSVDLPSGPASEIFWPGSYDPEVITTVMADDVIGARLDWNLLKRVVSGSHTINIKHDPQIRIAGRKPMVLISKNDTTPWIYDPESAEAIADRVIDLPILHRFNVVGIVAFQGKNTSSGRICTFIASVDPEDEENVPLIEYSEIISDLGSIIMEIEQKRFYKDGADRKEYDRLRELIKYIEVRADRYEMEGLARTPPPSRRPSPTKYALLMGNTTPSTLTLSK